MKKLVVVLTSTVGGAAGWWLGAQIGIMTAFIVSMIGTGIGIFYGARWARAHGG